MFMEIKQCNCNVISEMFESVPEPPEDESTAEMSNAEVDEAFSEWTPDSTQNVWELSGLYEGDIMLDKERNGMIKENFRWPNGTIPFYIRKQDFTAAQIDVIKSSMEEFHKHTCIRFKAWNEGDANYLYIRGNDKGCYSYVGMNGKAQVYFILKNGIDLKCLISLDAQS